MSSEAPDNGEGGRTMVQNSQNRYVSSGPLAHPFAHSLATLIHSLAAGFANALIHSLPCSLTPKLVGRFCIDIPIQNLLFQIRISSFTH